MPLRRMLAVTHETTITGAPMNLLHLISWIRANTDVEVHTLAMQDGPLRERFERVSPVTVMDDTRLAAALSVGERGLTRLGLGGIGDRVARLRVGPKLRPLGDFDLVYLNSLSSIGLLAHLPEDVTAVSHVHELQVAMRGLDYAGLETTFRERPDRWIACSGAVRDMLIDEAMLPADRVLLHHEFIDVAAVAGREVTAAQAAEVDHWKRQAGIAPTDAVVMGTGTLEWRKGPHLFLQLAAETRRLSDRPTHFVWVGGHLEGTDWDRIVADVERAHLDHVHFVGVKPDPVPWFAMADVFALTSHEDPYPLVCLEHAAMGNPIVTFRNGGMPELLAAAGDEAAQGIVEHLDVAAMAEQIVRLLADDGLATQVGGQLRAAVTARHDAPSAAKRLYDDLAGLFT